MSRNQEYVEQYAEYAMEQMRRYGIPASVTLAQGICESASGQSELSRKGNNHFGIKATSGWVQNGGKYLVYTDDRPNEKFCQYASVGDSYEHHSQFLKGNKRYSSLFKLSPEDYKGWTNGLQNSGYASNKKYASSLQSIIEKNNLQKYDQMVMKEMKAQGKSFGTETNPRQQGEQNSQKTRVSKPAESEKYSYPLKRNEFMLVTSPFGMRKDPLNPANTQMHKGIDLSSLLPSYKACSVNIQDGKPYLHADNGTVQFTREMTQAEMTKLQQTLSNADLSNDDKRRGVASIIQAATVSQQMSQNYQNGVDNQQDRQESVQIK